MYISVIIHSGCKRSEFCFQYVDTPGSKLEATQQQFFPANRQLQLFLFTELQGQLKSHSLILIVHQQV